jgi:hypothetical protein
MKASKDWEMERVLPLTSTSKNRTGPTAEDVTSLSADTLRRRYPDLIRRVSPRRIGIKMRDALTIANGAA